jgi:hypothetical protein
LRAATHSSYDYYVTVVDRRYHLVMSLVRILVMTGLVSVVV